MVKKPFLMPYRLGGPVEIANNVNGVTTWVPGTIVAINGPYIKVQMADGSVLTEGIDFSLKRAVRTEPSKIQMEDLPPEVAAPLYKKALVDILRETNTSRPNATVQRVIHIVKEALGELDS